MEIRRWHFYVVFNCAVMIPCLQAKPFSINEAIAAEAKQKQQSPKKLSTAESRQKQESQTKFKSEEVTGERFSLNTALNHNPLKPKQLKLAEGGLPKSKISSLKYRKTFQIKSPLKPKKLKHKQKLRNKRKNQSSKREISGNETFNKKYIPLLRSLGVLFDNILTTESIESSEDNPNQYRTNRHYYRERNGLVCSCSHKYDSSVANPKSGEETDTLTTTISQISTASETISTETAAPTTDYTPVGDYSTLRPNPNVPSIPTRDSFSTRGDNTRLSERSNAAFHRSSEGNITWNNRDSEHNTKRGENESSSADNEEDTDSFRRNGSSSDGVRGRIRGNRNETRDPIYRTETDKIYKSENSSGHDRGHIIELKKENKFETGENKTESTILVPELIRGFRGPARSDKVSNNTKFIQSKANSEESVVNVTHNNTSDKRFAYRNGTYTTENKKISTANEAVITIKDLLNPILMLQKNPNNNTPMVTIIDGYSVARDINGKNKISEKSVHVYP